MSDLLFNNLRTFEDASAKPHEYLYIRKIKPACVQLAEPIGDEVSFIVVDLETTGLDLSEEVIEVGAVKVHFSPSMQKVTRIDSILNQLEEPSKPIPEDATAVNGITDADVKGHRFDDNTIYDYFSDVEFVVAHGASFDRPHFDNRFPELAGLPWTCSIRDIPWRELGHSSAALEFLAYKHGFAYHAHRASSDAFATALLIAQQTSYLGYLLTALANVQYKICAFGSPFEVKDLLKARDYEWEATDRYWHITVGDEDAKCNELDYLEELYGGFENAGVTLIDATIRFTRA